MASCQISSIFTTLTLGGGLFMLALGVIALITLLAERGGRLEVQEAA